MPNRQKTILKRVKDFFTSHRLLYLFLLQAIGAVVWLFLIPGDPSSYFFLTLSKTRLMMVMALVLFCGVDLLFILKPNLLHVSHITDWLKKRNPKTYLFTAILMTTLIWLTLFLPLNRLGYFQEEFQRLTPILLFIFADILEISLSLIFSILPNQPEERSKYRGIGFLLFMVLLLSSVFLFLKLFDQTDYVYHGFYLGISSILTPLQGVLILVSVFLFASLSKPDWSGTAVVLTTGLLFIITAILLMTIPLTCNSDRPGPYPPNDTCYPQIDDAVFSTGSFYITQGEGINNHWLTDKPGYMLFLAFSQWITSPNIDQYLIPQTLLVALIPAMVFLFLQKRYGALPGLLAAVLILVKLASDISLYNIFASPNAKIESSEVFSFFILVIFTITLTNSLENPGSKRLVALSGGIIGTAILIRFTPVLLIPLGGLLYLINSILLRRQKKEEHRLSFWKIIFIFGIFILIAALPWFLTAQDAAGNNFYLLKIQDVIFNRFASGSADSTLSSPLASIPEYSILSIVKEKISEAFTFGGGNLSYMLTHFINNIFSSFAELPTTFTLFTSRTLSKTLVPGDESTPLWMLPLYPQQTILILLNAALILFGCLIAYKKHRIKGLIPLLIEISYFAGNSAAMTSGGRYLLPVSWVNILYFAIGLYEIFIIITNTLGFSFTAEHVGEELQTSNTKQDSLMSILVLFLILGMMPVVANHIPQQLPEPSGADVEAMVFQSLLDQGLVTAEEWLAIAEQENFLVFRGSAYHPSYYRPNNYYNGDNLLYQHMILTPDEVIVSNMLRTIPQGYFTDASDVIVVGCRIGEDQLWGMERTILRTVALIQLDNEQQTLVDESFLWTCNQ